MSNQLKSTGWIARNYNGRGLIAHNFASNNLIRSSSGVLWAALKENIQSKYIRIYRSTDNGFSWDLMWSGNFTQPGFRSNSIAGLNTNGPIMQLLLDERRNRMLLLVSMYNSATSKYQIEPFLFKLSASDYLTRVTAVGEATPPALTLIDNDMDELAFAASHNDDFIFMTYVTVSRLELAIAKIDEPIATEVMPKPTGTAYFNMHDTVADDNDYLHVAILEDRGDTNAWMYVRFHKFDNSWSTPTTIAAVPDDAVEPTLLRHPGGRLTLLYSEFLDTGNQIVAKETHSTDNGENWSTPVAITTTSSYFRDVGTTQLATRLNATASLEGDIYITYVGKVDEVDTCFWKKLTWDTDHYTQGTEHTFESYCSGAKFFNPTSTNLVTGRELVNLRLGYTIGQGNSTNQLDTTPVKIRQRTLAETVAEPDNPYETDSPADNHLPVEFNVVGAPNDNVDFYALGVVGATTEKYISAFDRIGTSMRIIRFEADPNSYLSDRSAFVQVGEYSLPCIFDSMSYEFPEQLGFEDFTTSVERDVRKIFIPPNFHLERIFALNNGEYLKRTIWTCLYDGNEYELSQVLPYFYDNQIVFYTANAYVIGPSNDPFAKNVLFTET